MGNLLTSLLSAAGAMTAYERSLGVVQNNVSNASTPGYVTQRQVLVAKSFQPAAGLSGGVDLGEIISSRDQFAEHAVRRQQEEYGRSAQQRADLSRLELLFDATGETGVPGALSKFFQTTSSWAVAPNDTTARQSVIDQADALAQSFRQTAAGLMGASADTDQAIKSTVANVNRLAANIRDFNEQVRTNASNANDAGLDASIHQALEDLAEYTDFTALQQADGTFTILLGGQTPLVVGARQYALSTAITDQKVQVLDSESRDITDQVHRGRLSSLLETKNQLIPEYLGGLNRLAASVADRVNAVLATGADPADPHPLFTYTSADLVAATLAVTAIRPAELASAPPTEPGGNSNVLALVGLASSTEIDGITFAGFFGNLGGSLGRSLDSAKERSALQEQLLAQARSLRTEVSGVSLNEEAVRMMEFQRSYQAAAKMVTVLDELTVTLLNMVR